MLQRVQTIWMFLAIIFAILLYIVGVNNVEGTANINIFLLCIGLLVLLGLISIFSYKKRKRQIILNNISIFLNALLIGLLTYWLLNLPGGFNFPEKGIELAFPLLAIIALVIANAKIRKDEKLVKSVDRFR